MTRDARLRSELDILAAIERGEVVAQSTLMRRIGVSIGLVNALLKRAVQKGYVKTRQVPYKRYAYYLTPKGFTEKGRLVAEYLDRSLHLFRIARNEYAELMAASRGAGMTRLVLIGGGDLAEIAVLAAWGEGVSLVGIIDPRANEPQRFGVPIFRSLAEAGELDAVVITDSQLPQATYDALREMLPEASVLAPPFLKVTRDRAELIAEQQRQELQA